MENLTTTIFWALSDFCKSECSYCPMSARGGEGYQTTPEYLRVAQILVDEYSGRQQRDINWDISGGEPLDIDDIAMILKFLRENGSFLSLTTNGGRLWIDWWAIEKYVDKLNLTFHHWQNPSLVKYLIQTFRKNNKQIYIKAPIRHRYVDEDLTRVLQIEDENDILIEKTLLYIEADQSAGMFEYAVDDLNKIDFYNQTKEERQKILERDKAKETPVVHGPGAKKKIFQDNNDWDTRRIAINNASPSFTGQLCNAGIEYLHIGPQGWVSGSLCRNTSFGNIWHNGWRPPSGPQPCTLVACVHDWDRKLTKFSLRDQ